MKNLDLNNIIFIGRSFSYLNGIFAGFIGDRKEVPEGFPAIYTISEKRYAWKDVNYKIGLHSENYVVSHETYYSSDLKSNIAYDNEKKPTVESGFYQVSEVGRCSLSDLFDQPLLINMNLIINGENKFNQSIIRLEKVKGLFYDKVKIINLTTPRKDEQVLFYGQAEQFIFSDIVNVRKVELLTGEDKTPEGWLQDQMKLSSDFKYAV